MNTLVYAAIALFILALTRTFSFGIYGLNNGNRALFVVALLLCVAGIALLYLYIQVELGNL